MSDFWEMPLDQTMRNSERLLSSPTRTDDVNSWFQQYVEAAPTSSNQGTANLPFQRWFRFKEAFSPKFVADTLGSLPYRVETCLDPFSGSGTTAVTCRMLGIDSIGIEVNPFLADLAEAKLTPVEPTEFRDRYNLLITSLQICEQDKELVPGMPLTFREPGVKARYVFSSSVFETARAIVRQSKTLLPAEARLLRVLLGSVLVDVSNVTINGKGRRYRGNWKTNPKTGTDLINQLTRAVGHAMDDLAKFALLPSGNHQILRGDSRTELARVTAADVAIFSPPYPNSFDYTDVYNIELWMLGYLNSSPENRDLRGKTLRSHVQTKWSQTLRKANSPSLQRVLSLLEEKRDELWNANIPEMVGFYFDDLWTVFEQLSKVLKPGRHAIVAIGDSQYAGVHIDVAEILKESVLELGFDLITRGEMRSMRSSSQHGGSFDLSEHCLVFERLETEL
jgi:hypothetical protein